MTDLDIAPAWRKSSRSGTQGGECVEVAAVRRPGAALSGKAAIRGMAAKAGIPAMEPMVCMRDSKDPGGGVLTFSPAEWRAFAREVKHGRFDRSDRWRVRAGGL